MDNFQEDPINDNPVLLARDISHRQYRDGVKLASSLIARDSLLILLLWPLLFTCSVITHFVTPLTYELLTLLTIIERAGCTLFFFLIARRWIKEFTSGNINPGFICFLRLVSINLSLWFLVSLSSLSSTLQHSYNLQLIYLFLLIPFLGFTLQFYFYFMPILFGIRSWREILQESLTYIPFHRSLPLKLIAGPLVLSLFFVSVIHMIAPDGRYLSVSVGMDIAESVFWILNTYLSLGVGFSILSDRVNAPLVNPYLKSRLDTLRAFAPGAVSAVLSPGNGLKFATVTALILYANLMRLWDTPPAPTLTIQSVAIEEKNAVVQLAAEDKEFHFRGFNPALFHMAGETGEPISSKAPAVLADGKEVELGLPFSRNEDSTVLQVTFTLVNRAEDIKSLKDVYLWYGQVKLIHLSPFIR